jgi:hypothetical protein
MKRLNSNDDMNADIVVIIVESALAISLMFSLQKVIREMNRLGMLIDLSHVSANTSRAVIKLSKAPVIFSHSAVYSLCNHNRNVPDDIILSVVSILFFSIE